MKLLIVEDERVQRKFLQAMLTRAGHEVISAADGLEAWKMLEENHLRLVITDWQMPVMDGQELIRRIRAASFPNYTYIIVLTSRDSKNYKLEGLQSGADDYLIKPPDQDELIARLAIAERILNLESSLNVSLARLELLAALDSLTGLYNRRAFYESAQAELNRASRDRTPVSLILLDIDHFKAINDNHGHPAGDQALRQLAEIIKRENRAYDQVARWGGEEFLILLPNTKLPEAGAVAERLRTSIASSIITLPGDVSLRVTISLGVSCAANPISSDGSTLEKLLQEADKALYRAKTSGRNRTCVFEDGSATSG
jgi:diguanylate cyclase (GGDEF)-like protein